MTTLDAEHRFPYVTHGSASHRQLAMRGAWGYLLLNPTPHTGYPMPTTMRRLLLLTTAILSLAAVVTTPARAGSVTFDASGTFFDNSSLSGSITIDATLGTILSADLLVSPSSGPSSMTHFAGTTAATTTLST